MKTKIIVLLLSLQLAVGVTSLCATGRIYIGNVNMSNAELIVFNGIYVQLPSATSNDSVQLPSTSTSRSGSFSTSSWSTAARTGGSE